MKVDKLTGIVENLYDLAIEEVSFLYEANELLQSDKELRWFMATKSGRELGDNAKLLSDIMKRYSKSFSEVERKFVETIKKSLPNKGSGKQFQFIHQLKSLPSIVDKVLNRDKNPMKISDLVRGAVLFKNGDEMDNWISDFKRKYSPYISSYEFKDKGSDPKFGYYGSHHFDLKIDGMTVELQVMPAKLWKYKIAAHNIYDKWRSSITPVPEIEKQLSKYLFNLGNKTYLKEQLNLDEAVKSFLSKK
jgi:ppGpp synthetase/RelA/SpoT-type nucleotidyltranferase